MALEVKELLIKVQITEREEQGLLAKEGTDYNLNKLKQEIIDTCISKVMEKIKEKEER